MEKILGVSVSDLKKGKGYFTAKEISQQPLMWKKMYDNMKNSIDEIIEFNEMISKKDNLRIILTGAGSSEFIGQSLQPYLDKVLPYNVESIGTTDIVSHPETYFKKDQPILLVSYGRSGNSPESLATVNLANEYVDEIYHLVITCNAKGKLATEVEPKKENYILLLPDETHDKGFAMTSSFTTPMLSTLMFFEPESVDYYEVIIDDLIKRGEFIINDQYEIIREIADEDYKRVVYLGAESLKGIARESSLKLLELTAGKTSVLFDTALGFRHGPKSYVDEETLIVLFLSNDAYARKYEYDLINELTTDQVAKRVLIVHDDIIEEAIDEKLLLTINNQWSTKLESVHLGMVYLMVAQIFALYKSMNMNITPDNPCPAGLVNRVVQGVIIHEK